LQPIGPVCLVSRIRDLQKIVPEEAGLRVGASVTITDLRNAIADRHPDLAELLRRFGSVQIRNAATIGGNIANGSPVGDAAPALIALAATLRLRRGNRRRTMPLEDFFRSYGKQDIEAGEFVESVFVPDQPDRLRCYKLSKRFDQDISAVLGCFNITVENGFVSSARIAMGGMAEIPRRATATESALVGLSWERTEIHEVARVIESDFSPISDFRASAKYRMAAAKNMLLRYFLEDAGESTRILQQQP